MDALAFENPATALDAWLYLRNVSLTDFCNCPRMVSSRSVRTRFSSRCVTSRTRSVIWGAMFWSVEVNDTLMIPSPWSSRVTALDRFAAAICMATEFAVSTPRMEATDWKDSSFDRWIWRTRMSFITVREVIKAW